MNLVTHLLHPKSDVEDDDVETLYLEKRSETLHKSAPKPIDNLETTPLATKFYC